MSREAMQMALDMLNEIADEVYCDQRVEEVITALRQALETEPFEYWNAVEGWVKIDEMREHFDSVGCGTIYKSDGEGRSPLYTAPTKREWVGLTDEEISRKRIMDREDIIRMAREAGLYVGRNISGVQLVGSSYEEGGLLVHLAVEELERFAALVAAHEREACANLLLNVDLSSMDADHRLQSWTATVLLNFSDAIRARGER